MKALTLVEESAIRQLTPILHMVTLSHGSSDTKGNTNIVTEVNTPNNSS